MRQPFVKLEKVGEVKIVAKKRSHDTPKEINEYLKQSKGNMTISKISECLGLPKTQVEHYFRADKSRAIPSPKIWSQLKELLNFDDTYDTQVTSIYEKEVEFESSRRVYSDKGLSPTIDSTKKGGFITTQAVLTPGRLEKRQNGRRIKKDGEPMFTLTGQDQHGVMVAEATKKGSFITRDSRDNSKPGVSGSLRASRTLELGVPGESIRRLTPVECCRLQGFPDDWNEKGIIDGEIVEISDTQRYKQCGNAVTVDVVQAVAERIYAQETKPKNISTKP